MDLICFMHEGTPYGYLKVNQKVIHEVKLARMTGLTADEFTGYLSELEEAGVVRRDEAGCIYSKRMVEDEKCREKRKLNGKKGGNPKLTDKKLVNQGDNQVVKQIVADEDSRKQKKELDSLFSEFWEAYPNKKKKPAALAAFKRLKPDKQMLDSITTALAEWKQSKQWLKDGGEFIPHPATWLNGHQWKDDPGPKLKPEWSPGEDLPDECWTL
jgi:hypothetical protein